MFIHKPETASEEGSMKEIKVRIPVDYHWRLHTLKLTSGVHISQVVRHALNEYFHEVFETPGEASRDEAETEE